MSFNKEKKAALARFLERRNLKSRLLDHLREIFEENELKRGDLTQAKDATYSVLVENLLTAIKEGWTTNDEVANLLDESEIAGRQHVCIFELPDKQKDAAEVLNLIATPDAEKDELVAIDEFLEVPRAPYARVLQSDADTALVKIVAPRKYWRSETPKEYASADEEWVHRWLVTERSAVIVKCDTKLGLVQIRVPPREHSQEETARTVYEFLTTALANHYVGKKAWFTKVRRFDITNAFTPIIENRVDFFLRHDTPESDTAKSRISKLGSLKLKVGSKKKPDDLRDDKMWIFANGYSRKSLRGHWMVGQIPVYVHFNADNLRVDAKTTVDFARIFFPHLVTDGEVDYVLKRVKELV